MHELLEILLWVGAIIWTILLLQGMINGCLVHDLRNIHAPAPKTWPLVSYIVPARNEEKGIGQAVTSFCQQDYPNLEVIVINDRSTDRTSQILSELQEKFDNLIVVEGTEPPEDWFGKANAMRLGMDHAKGDWILLADGDAVHDPSILRRAICFGLHDEAGMVTLRPRFITGSVLEAAVMSGITYFFFVATPIFLVRYSKSALFATGSGVFNLLRRDTLDACGGIACIRRAVVDDLEIGFCVKRAGHRISVAHAGTLLNLRMYYSIRETFEGFTKNTFPSIRKTPYLMLLYYIIAPIMSFLPYYGFVVGLVNEKLSVPATISLCMMHTIFAWIAWRFRQPWYITFLNPLRELGWLWIMTRSFVVYMRKGLVWRERVYGRGA